MFFYTRDDFSESFLCGLSQGVRTMDGRNSHTLVGKIADDSFG